MDSASSTLNPKISAWSSRFVNRLLVQISTLASLVIVCLALWVVYRTLQTIRLADVVENFRALPASSVLLAFCFTVASYVVMTGFEVVALHHINRPLSYPRAALAGFLAAAVGSNLGFAMVTGGAIRYRIYSQAGLSALEIAGVTTLFALTVTLGIGFILTLAMLFGTGEAAGSVIHLRPEWRRAIGGFMLALMVAYITIAAIRPMTIRTPSWSLQLPSAKTTLVQIALATIDLMLVGALIYVMLPAQTNFLAFLSVFVLALMAGGVSHVPGGIGVFESVMLLGLPEVPPAALLGAILLFRCIYYLAPLSLAAILLAIHEATLQRTRFKWARDTTTDWLAEIGPQVMALVVVFSGVLLLFSGAVPAPRERLAWLQGLVPLAALEAAHIIAGAAGLGLVVLARGLSLRLDPAYRLIIALLGIGAAALLLKGLIYEGALILGVVLAVLLIMHREFRRKASLFDQGFPPEWISTLTAILAVTVWLGLFSYKFIEYSPELWWHFAYEAEFPRFLRTTVAVFALIGGILLVNLLRPDPIPDLLHAVSLDHVRRIVKQDPNVRANLALLGDKRFLFSDSGKAFIMYRVKGKSWVALGGPVGPRVEHERLVGSFWKLSDRYGGWPVFYLLDAEGLSLYVDLGLALVKLGDDARVPLATFSLESADRAELRQIYDRVRKQNVSFEMVNSAKVPPLLPELKRVSDDWLIHTQRSEKSFSSGFFEPNYVANFPCALVRHDNHIVAFAILWVNAHKEELALDLMRYHRDAPAGIMEFLVTELMLGGGARGYRWFNLGMVPLAGFEHHALAPLWQRVGGMIYRQSEHFRDSESLRRFAEKLGSVWQPKYLASPGSLKTPRILRDIARLIAQAKI
jgi:phosphatidylglycerol lysyltransferase